MKIIAFLVPLTVCLASPANAQDEASRWVTFKTGTWPGYGRVLHQIDRTTIKQEGPYKTFSTRVWLVGERQPLAFSYGERIFFESQKYAVDCRQGQFGSRFIESNNPRAIKTSLPAMRWVKLEKVPAVAGTVCGKK